MTMVWLVSRSRLKVPPGTSSPYISPLAPSGQRNCAPWVSQLQKSVTLPPQPGGGDHESSYEHVVALERKNIWDIVFPFHQVCTEVAVMHLKYELFVGGLCALCTSVICPFSMFYIYI